MQLPLMEFFLLIVVNLALYAVHLGRQASLCGLLILVDLFQSSRPHYAPSAPPTVVFLDSLLLCCCIPCQTDFFFPSTGDICLCHNHQTHCDEESSARLVP